MTDKEGLKILAFTNDTASHVWRFDPQARRMNEQTPHQMALAPASRWGGDTLGADIVIMEMLSGTAMVDTAHNMGAKVIYEADDPVTDTYGKERKNLMHVSEEHKSSSIETIGKVDAVTTTNEILAKNLRRYTDAPIYVMPILMDYLYYGEAVSVELPKRNTDEIRIGWFGGAGHFEDLRMVLPALRKLIEKDKRVKFVYCGYGGMESESLAMKAQWGEDVLKEIPRERREFMPGVPEEYWPMKHRFMDLDIGICPLIDDNFNKHKEGTKWLEYSALGIPAVCSSTVYDRYVSHGKTGLIAKTEDGWYGSLLELIRKSNLRKQIGISAEKEVRDNYNADTSWQRWVKIYQDIVQK